MAKKTEQSTDNFSWHGQTYTASVNRLIKAFGEPTFEGEGDKINYEWELETDSGIVFTIYDWKKAPGYNRDSPVTWHIGALTKSNADIALKEITKQI